MGDGDTVTGCCQGFKDLFGGGGQEFEVCRHLDVNIVLHGKIWSLLNASTVSSTG